MSEDKTWNPQVQPDFDKLGKLDKLLGKIEGDIQKRVKDMERSKFVETLKKSHEVYQLVLGEIHFQFCELQLEMYGDIIMKIFTGQNTLINILLKMKTNLDFNPEQLMQNLENLKKTHNKEQQRRSSFSSKETHKQQEQEIVVTQQRGGGRKNQQMEMPTNNQSSKVLVDQFTSTQLDAMTALDIANLKNQKDQVEKITKEIDEGQEEIDNFLNQKRNFNRDIEASQAENKLKNVLKDLATGQKKIQTIEEDERQMLLDEQAINNQMGELQNSLKDQFNKNKGTHPKNQIPEILTENQKVINGVLIEIRHYSTQADDQILVKYNKLRDNNLELQSKFDVQGKNLKDSYREGNILTDNVKKLQGTIMELKLNIESLKNDERKRLELARSQIIMGAYEKDKLKQITSENFKMKLKLKELFDVITALEKDNKNNLQKFKNYILGSSGYTDEQKRQLIGKIEELFTVNVSSKINMRELEVMSRIDESLLKDKFFKDCIGDPQQILKQLRVQQKDNKQKMARKNYDADFDPDLLLENQILEVRKVKKMIKRKDSKTGEWIEEEIEVDELVVVDKLTGEVIRSKELVQDVSAILDKNISQFMDSHGGLAIGGAKFIKPQPISGKRPKAKDGKQIVEGEWFEDDKGNMVRMKKNKKGEEEFEVKETYTDENGVQRDRIKKVKYRTDGNGNDVVEEEYIDPKTGLKYKIEKKTFKDKDGCMVYEEVMIDANGQRTVKRTRVKKDKSGNEIVEEEIIDSLGRKQIIKTKVVKDANGNDVIIQEIMNSDGTKTVITEKIGTDGQKVIVKETLLLDGTKQIVTEKIDESGAKIIIVEKVDKRGKKELISEKKVKMGDDGKITSEEFTQDDKGNRIIKNTKKEIDKDGYEVEVSEVVGADGKKKIIRTKVVRGEDGQDVQIEETIDEHGQVQTKTTKIRIDEHGNKIIIEEYMDAKGNKIIKTKKINIDGSIETEEFNTQTNEKKIKKQMTDENGRTIIEEITIDKNGKKKIKNILESVDQYGNITTQEVYIDPITKKKMIVNKKVTVDKHGRQIIEENEVDEDGNVRNIKKKVYIDKDGSEIIETEITGSDGKKQKIKQKKFIDSNGNQIIEEERIDEKGNKIITKRVINKDGTESIEEVTIGKDGKKNIVKRNIRLDGTVEEEVTTSDGRTYVTIKKLGFDDKQCQTDQQSLDSFLSSLGIDSDKILQIQSFLKTGQIGGQKINQAQLNALRKKDMDEKRKAELQAQLEADNLQNSGSDDEDKLIEIDENMSPEMQEDLLYKQLLIQGGEMARNIRNQFGMQGNSNITKQQFSEYLQRLKDVHVKCGENCPHLKRFYAKLGFIESKCKRRQLKMKDNKIKAFEKKLPKI